MPQTHTVKGGDTLSGIGKQYGVDYKTITGYKSGNPNLIYPGEVLTISGGQSAPAAQQTTQSRPTTQNAVTPYLGQFQDNLLAKSNAPEVRIQTPEEVRSDLKLTAAPVLFDRVAYMDKQRTDLGLAASEKSLTDIKDQIEAEQGLIRKARGIEEGKPVPMGVIAGRISEQEKVSNERIDALGRQQSRLTDDLNTKYRLVETYMKAKELNYQDAVQKYDTEYKQSLQIYDIIQGQKKEARSEKESERDAAKANLAVYSNAITSGNMSYANLSSDQLLTISKLEIQSGLPVGFISNLQMSPKDRIMGFSEDKTQAWIIGQDGNLKTIQTGLTAKPTGGAAGFTSTQMRSAKGSASSLLRTIDEQYRTSGGKTIKLQDKESFKGDKRLSLQEYQEAVRQLMEKEGIDAETADDILQGQFDALGYKKWNW